MSVPRLRLAVTEPARLDTRNVLRYSGRQWGSEQRHRYRQSIDRAFETLRAHPELGRQHDEFFAGCRTFPVGQHMIYYRVDATEIVIVRILHRHQDATEAVFDPPAPEPGHWSRPNV